MEETGAESHQILKSFETGVPVKRTCVSSAPRWKPARRRASPTSIAKHAKMDGHGNFRQHSPHGPGTGINSQETELWFRINWVFMGCCASIIWGQLRINWVFVGWVGPAWRASLTIYASSGRPRRMDMGTSDYTHYMGPVQLTVKKLTLIQDPFGVLGLLCQRRSDWVLMGLVGSARWDQWVRSRLHSDSAGVRVIH